MHQNCLVKSGVPGISDTASIIALQRISDNEWCVHIRRMRSCVHFLKFKQCPLRVSTFTKCGNIFEKLKPSYQSPVFDEERECIRLLLIKTTSLLLLLRDNLCNPKYYHIEAGDINTQYTHTPCFSHLYHYWSIRKSRKR